MKQDIRFPGASDPEYGITEKENEKWMRGRRNLGSHAESSKNDSHSQGTVRQAYGMDGQMAQGCRAFTSCPLE